MISVAIGSLITVILGWLYSNQRLARLETTMDARFARLESSNDTRFNKVDSEIAQLRDMVYRSLVSLHERVAVVEAKQG